MDKSSSSEHHAHLTRVVAVIEHRVAVSSVVPRREPNDSFPVLPPDSERQDDLLLHQIDVVVKRKDSFCLNAVPRHESVVQTVLGDSDEF